MHSASRGNEAHGVMFRVSEPALCPKSKDNGQEKRDFLGTFLFGDVTGCGKTATVVITNLHGVLVQKMRSGKQVFSLHSFDRVAPRSLFANPSAQCAANSKFAPRHIGGAMLFLWQMRRGALGAPNRPSHHSALSPQERELMADITDDPATWLWSLNDTAGFFFT
ncbi:hypothetical protein EDB85DRAFT_1566077 [Lactarius pseudohatsudake]|nr:hypothetical protein EDB85DRAFT_1566077 [Lactarius pseudohatsudake]